MPRKSSSSRALVPAKGAGEIGVPPPGRTLAGTSIPPVEVYRVPELRPSTRGPWDDEYDKLAWRDPATGLDCIVRRDGEGALHGYLAIGADHPFYGIAADALPHDPPLRVHGGVDYAEPCDADEPRSLSICHVGMPQAGSVVGWTSAEEERTDPTASTRLAVAGDDAAHGSDAWWFGFGADKSYDYVPRRDRHVARLGTENGRVYRDERYMVRETMALARQLHAVGVGAPPPDVGTARPPIGLDPHEPLS